MRKIYIIVLCYSFYVNSFKVIDEKDQTYNINPSGYGALTVQAAKNLIQIFYPKINTKNLDAYKSGYKLSDMDYVDSLTLFKENTKKVIIDDYIRLLADLVDNKKTILERIIIQKIENIKNIKDNKIRLIHKITKQDEDFKKLLSDLIQKLIDNPATAKEWNYYIKLAANGEKKEILAAILDHVMK